MKKEKKKKIDDAVNSLWAYDKPTWALTGAMLGFLLNGVVYMIFGALSEAPDGQLWSGKAILAGLASVGISLGIAVFIFVYWYFVPKKKGVVFPSLVGVGWVLAILAFWSAVMISARLVTDIGYDYYSHDYAKDITLNW